MRPKGLGRIGLWLAALILAAGVATGVPGRARAETHYRYEVMLRDRQGHQGAVTVCAINPQRAKEKALARWGHQGHKRRVVKITKKGVCQPPAKGA